MEEPKIAIITTVASKELYTKTSKLFPAGIARYTIDGSNGMHGLHSIIYMFKKLRKTNIKWLIMMDEDVILRNEEELFSLIEYMENQNVVCCGVRDGGEIAHRKYNPYVINTFFSILNFEQLKKSFSPKEVLNNQYMERFEFDDDLSTLKYKFDEQNLYEPYYCFYFWMRRKGFKMLFLDSEMLNDGIANRVFSNNGVALLDHTWYARSYAINDKHTKRIDNLMEIDLKDYNIVRPIVFKDRFFYLKRLFKKYLKRIQNRF